ncbi:hypothetical protein BH11BAC5_BH11BAC5_41990 [soil metagenome]
MKAYTIDQKVTGIDRRHLVQASLETIKRLPCHKVVARQMCGRPCTCRVFKVKCRLTKPLQFDDAIIVCKALAHALFGTSRATSQ